MGWEMHPVLVRIGHRLGQSQAMREVCPAGVQTTYHGVREGWQGNCSPRSHTDGLQKGTGNEVSDAPDLGST